MVQTGSFLDVAREVAQMVHVPTVSIIVNNFNYGRFLKHAVKSALDQSWPDVEVIVVDDGSTDDSRDIIRSFQDAVVPVLKENAGQGSAFNAGFAQSSGEFVCFLDADDALMPQTIEQVVSLFDTPDVVKVHWPLWIIDSTGARTGGVVAAALPEGDFRQSAYRDGPATMQSPPTSGNAYRRSFLKRVLPMPEHAYRISADAYLYGLAPAFGTIRCSEEPLGLYRRHGSNTFSGMSFIDKVRAGVEDYMIQSEVLKKVLTDEVSTLDTSRWGEKAWWMMIQKSLIEIQEYIPEGSTFILAGAENWGTDPIMLNRNRLLFNERDGCYWGQPEDDAAAIAEFERLRRCGGAFLVVAWPVYWWREYFPSLFSYLEQASRCLLENERISVYDLRSRPFG